LAVKREREEGGTFPLALDSREKEGRAVSWPFIGSVAVSIVAP